MTRRVSIASAVTHPIAFAGAAGSLTRCRERDEDIEQINV
jgi:hypothetical protein